MEEYKEIPGYEGYGISKDGQVMNLTTGKLLRVGLNSKSRYAITTLKQNGKFRHCPVHVLMAITYLGYIRNGKCDIVVDHINDNPRDNRLENLQIITSRKNRVKSIKHRSLPTGVQKNGKRFSSQLYSKGTLYYFGCFDTPEQASEAYQNKLREIS